MKRVLAVLCACVLAVCVSACSKKEAGEVRVILDWTPNTNHTGLYVAMDKGWYTEAGFTTVRIEQPPEETALTLLGNGSAEFAVSFQESMAPTLASEHPLPVTAVAAITQNNTSGILSMADRGITAPKDLEGRRFAFWESDLVDAMMKSIVETDGGDVDKVIMVPNSATDALAAIQTDIDAIWVYYGWDGIAAELAGLDTNYFAFRDIDPVFDFYTPVLAISDRYAQEHPEEAKKFMEATARGYEYAAENPEEAARILLKYASELDEDLVLASQVYLSSEYLAGEPVWGPIDRERWTAFNVWMYEEGLLESNIGSAGFTNEFLPE